METKSIGTINLESLLQLSARFNEARDDMFILNSAILSLMGKLRMARSCVLLADKESNVFKPLIIKGKTTLLSSTDIEVGILPKLDECEKTHEVLLEAGYQYCFPIKYESDLLALLCLGQRFDKTDLGEDELRYAWLVSTITGTALNNARNHISLIKAKTNLEQQNQLLESLFEMSRDFSGLLSHEQIIRMLSYRLMGQLMVSKFALFIIDDNGKIETAINRFDFEISKEVIFELTNQKNAALIFDIEFSDKSKEFLVNRKVEIVAPMLVHGGVKGIVFIGKKMNGEDFSSDNLQFIDALVNRAIVAIENERLFNTELEKKRLESELDLALEIQKNLLPKKIPQINGFDISGISIPSRHVGGDYFDVIKLGDDKLLLAIADVSGKGMPASLIMANVQAALRALSDLSLTIKEIIRRVNSIIYQNTSAEKFVTFFCSILDTRNKTIEYINAGHNPPILLRADDSYEFLSEGGLILGFLDEDIPYKEGKKQIENGDVVLFYTDGVSEASNSENQEYGENKIISELIKFRALTTQEILDEIIKSVRKFSAHSSQYDDITILAIKVRTNSLTEKEASS